MRLLFTVLCMSNCQHVFARFHLIGPNSVIVLLKLFFLLPSYHCIVAMAPHTTDEMCERMVVWRSELGKSDAEIATLAHCSERTVRDVLRLHRTFGVVRDPYAQPVVAAVL